MGKIASQTAPHTYNTNVFTYYHTEIKPFWKTPALSIGLIGVGEALKRLSPMMKPSIWSCLLLCIALLPPALPTQGSFHPGSALHLSLSQFYLLFFSDYLLPASKRSTNARYPISFLNLDLVSLSETCFSTKRFPSDTAEEKYVSIVCEALLCPDYHTDRWITHIPPLPSNKLPAERPQRLHRFCAALKSTSQTP